MCGRTTTVSVLITYTGVLHQSKGCERGGHTKGSMHTATNEPILSSISQMGLETLLSPCLNFISATPERVFGWQTGLVSKSIKVTRYLMGRSQQFRLTNHKALTHRYTTSSKTEHEERSLNAFFTARTTFSLRKIKTANDVHKNGSIRPCIVHTVHW